MHVFQSDNALIVLEGRIYNRDNIDHELRTLSDIVLAPEQPDKSRLLNWLDSLDGEFLVFLYDKEQERTFILNDILGRLPTFYHIDNDSFILTRELNLIPRLLPSIQIDRLALAQTLLFSFPLYGRTMIQNVQRLAPATLIELDPESEQPKINILNQLDYTHETGRSSIRDTAVELAELFTQATAQRVEPNFQNTVSLSGGLDSRVAAAALSQIDSSTVAHTFAFKENTDDIESTLAARVCRALGIEWKQFLLPPISIAEIEKLVVDNSGLCNIANAEQESFIEDIRTSHNNRAIMFTGDGGDELVPSLVPTRRFLSVPDLGDYIIGRLQMLPIDIVCALTSVPESDFRDELCAVVDRFSEPNLKDRFVHFMLSEKMVSRTYGGDNCNRNRLWTGTPFLSYPFLRRAIAVDESHKRYHRLYRHFLNHISHEAAAIPDAKRNRSILDRRYELERRLVRILNSFPSLATRLKKRRAVPTRYRRDHVLIQLLTGLSESDSGLSKFINRQVLTEVLANTDRYSRESIDNLATACLAVLLYTNPDFSLT